MKPFAARLQEFFFLFFCRIVLAMGLILLWPKGHQRLVYSVNFLNLFPIVTFVTAIVFGYLI
jgi:hypothetical protein